MDAYGLADRDLIVVVDSSYFNRTVVSALPHRTELIGRTRKDARLCRPIEARDGKRVYGQPLPTPMQMGQDQELPWTAQTFTFGCSRYPFRFKEISPVLWPNGTKSRPLRLVVTGPVGHGHGPQRGYRHYGHLLATNLERNIHELIQSYLYRWEIEVLHRTLKDGIGIGQTQCLASSPKVFAAIAAFYALLSLVCRPLHGDQRSEVHPRLTKWQANLSQWQAAKRRREGRPVPIYRPTIQDTITLLRSDLNLHWENGILRCS